MWVDLKIRPHKVSTIIDSLPAGLRVAQPCRYYNAYCFYSVVQNGFFAPQGRHVAPINVKFGTVRSPVPNYYIPGAILLDACIVLQTPLHLCPWNFSLSTVRSPVPNFMFIGAEMWEYSPQNCQISNFGHKCSSHGRLVCTIFTKFSAFVCVYR